MPLRDPPAHPAGRAPLPAGAASMKTVKTQPTRPSPGPAVSRRSFVKGTGVLLVGFSLAGASRLTGAAPASAQAIPGAAQQLDSWLAIARDGSVTLFTGKVDLGTGIETALAQIAAEELDVPFARVKVVQGDTAYSPDQGPTVGSA